MTPDRAYKIDCLSYRIRELEIKIKLTEARRLTDELVRITSQPKSKRILRALLGREK